MKTILYIHGLSSSGASSTARHLQSLLPDTRIIAPDLPLEPLEVLKLLHVNGNEKCTDFGNWECTDFGNNNAPISVTTIHNFR